MLNIDTPTQTMQQEAHATIHQITWLITQAARAIWPKTAVGFALALALVKQDTLKHVADITVSAYTVLSVMTVYIVHV